MNILRLLNVSEILGLNKNSLKQMNQKSWKWNLENFIRNILCDLHNSYIHRSLFIRLVDLTSTVVYFE